MRCPKLLVALAVACILTLAGWRGYAVYQHWRARESVAQARGFLRQGQSARAALSIQAGLAFDEYNAEALQLAAELLEGQGDFKAIQFRQRFAALSRADPDAQIAVAETALRFNQLETARQALDAVLEADRSRPEFLSAQAACFAMSGNPSEAARLYNELLVRAPEHPLAKAARVNLARLWLGSPIEEQDAKAAALLESLAGDPGYGAESLRMRARRALKLGKAEEALRLSTQLADLPKARLEDRMLQLDALRACRSPMIDTALIWLEQSVAGNPVAESELAGWILANRGAAGAAAWLKSLPASEQTRMPVPVVLADCQAALKDWASLEKLVGGKNWGKLEPQRLGLQARACWGQGDNQAAARAWAEAIQNSRNQAVPASALARMAAADGHLAEACDALWCIPDTDPGFPGAQNQLFAYYQEKKDAGNLLRVLDQALTARPAEIDLKRSIAALLLISDREIPRAVRLAGEAYRGDPKPIANAAVYAFSLLVSGHAADAAQLLEGRTEEEKRSDSAVSYYVLILSARGRIDEARKYARSMNRQALFPGMLARIEAAEAGWSAAH